MILNTEGIPPAITPGFVPAWDAVGRAQAVQAQTYKLVRQPDHAHLAGELVQHLSIPGAPALSDDIAYGIWAHDEGWAEFDSGSKKYEATPATYSEEGVALNDKGVPLTFFEVRPGDALVAWKGSIDNAETVASVAGLIVSGHFRRLAKFGLATGHYASEDETLVRSFLADEEKRHERLMKLQSSAEEEVCYWTDVLRFCDLLSLYLCSGSGEAIEFPEQLGPNDETIRLRPIADAKEFSPSIFDRETEFVVTAYIFPGGTSTGLQLKVR